MSDHQNIPEIGDRQAFRSWLTEHSDTESECWLELKRGRPTDDAFCYLDAVEEALCFGWIDSTQKIVGDRRLQRFSPRQKNSPWTELNKARVRRLERLGMMTDRGRAALPPMGPRSFKIPSDIETALKQARVWSRFRRFPKLYQRVRAYNIQFYADRNRALYDRALAHLIAATKQGRMYGEWNDYGRLTDEDT